MGTKLFACFSSLSKRTDWAALENEAVARRDAREVASRFSRGNVAVQMGYFLTGPDLDRERTEVSRLKFPD